MDGFDIPLDDIAADAEEEPDVDEETSFIDPVPIDVEQAGGTSERRRQASGTTARTPADNCR